MICMGSFAISNSQYPESRGTFGSAIAKIPATYVATPGLIPAEPFSELDQLGRRTPWWSRFRTLETQIK